MMSLQFTYDVMPHLTDIISNIMGYIMVYILIQAEPWLVLPSVSIAKSVLKTFKNPLQACQSSCRYHQQQKRWQQLQIDPAGPPRPS
jgi:hypothetical protein